MAYKEWPSSLSGRAGSIDRPRLIGQARNPGRTASGVMPAGRTDGGGLWTYGFQSVALRTKDHILTWEALGAYLAEGVIPIVVPFCNKSYFPAPLGDDGKPIYSRPSVSFSDDTFFSDGTGFYQPVVVATVTEAAALRATTLKFDMVYGGALRGWHPFTIVHPTMGPRLYGIKSIEDIDGSNYTVKIEPPLREAVDADEPLDFDRPRCVVQLNGTMPLNLSLNKFGSSSVSFLESFLPEPE